MKEIKDNIVYINGKPIHLFDLCQVVSVYDDMPQIITQWFDFIGTREECWNKINTTDVYPEKGSHFSIATSKLYTIEKEYADYGLTALRQEDQRGWYNIW